MSILLADVSAENEHDKTLMLIAMVEAVRAAGGAPTSIVMHPDDYLELCKENCARYVAGIAGLPIELDEKCERGKALAVA